MNKEFKDALTKIINSAYFLADNMKRILDAAKVLEEYELGKKKITDE